jgi:hypothetical protein
MSQFKIKKNQTIIAQTDIAGVAAWLALSYSADVYYSNSGNAKVVWNNHKDFDLIVNEGKESLKVIEGAIGCRTESFRAARQARFIKRMEELGQSKFTSQVSA